MRETRYTCPDQLVARRNCPCTFVRHQKDFLANSLGTRPTQSAQKFLTRNWMSYARPVQFQCAARWSGSNNNNNKKKRPSTNFVVSLSLSLSLQAWLLSIRDPRMPPDEENQSGAAVTGGQGWRDAEKVRAQPITPSLKKKNSDYMLRKVSAPLHPPTSHGLSF